MFISFIRKRLTKPSCVKDQSLCWKHKSQTATSEQSFLMSVLREIIIFARTWQANVLIKEHPDRKANFDKPYCKRTFSQITIPINRSDVNDEWQWTVSIFTWDLLCQWPFKFIFCLYRVFSNSFFFMWEIFVWRAVAKIALSLVEPGIHPTCRKTKFFLQNEETLALMWHTVHIVIMSLWSLKEQRGGGEHKHLAFISDITSRWLNYGRSQYARGMWQLKRRCKMLLSLCQYATVKRNITTWCQIILLNKTLLL